MTGAPSVQDRASLKTGLSFAVGSFAANAALALLSSVLLGRLFGIHVVGQVALVLAPQGAMVFLSTVQEQPALVRRLAALAPRDRDATGLFVVTFAFSFALTAAIAAIVAGVTAWAFNGPVDHPDLVAPALVMLLGYVVLWNVSWNLDSVFAANGDGRSLFAVRLHQSLIYIVALVVAGVWVPNVWGVVAATLISWGPPLLHRLWLVRAWLDFSGWQKSARGAIGDLPGIVGFGLRMAPGSIAAGASTEAGTWLLGAMAPVAQVGAFNRAFTLSRRLEEVTWRISEIVMPNLAAAHASGDVEGEHRAWVAVCRIGVTWLVLVAAVGAGAAEPLMALFGPGFEEGATALALLLFLPSIYLVVLLQSDLLVVHGRPGTITVMTVSTAGFTILAEVVLIPEYGASGAAAGMVAGALLRVGVGQLVVGRVTGLTIGPWWPWRARVAPLLAAALAFAATTVVATTLGAGVPALIPALLIGFAVGLSAEIALGVVGIQDLRKLSAAAFASRRSVEDASQR